MRTSNIFNSKNLLLLLLVGTIGLTGCKKSLDINENPNNPDSASPSLLLPTVQAAVGQLVGNSFQVYGNLWGQYWTQSPNSSQYRAIDQYNITNSSFDRPWLTLYRSALINAELIINTQGAGLEHTKGMAYLLKAYSFQLATDAFGDIPLTEALKGSEFGQPKYDAQALVYDSLFSYIDKGTALLNTSISSSPGEQDMIFSGDVNRWKAFANTLKLRAYLRIAQVDPSKAKAGIVALYATNPTFITSDAAIKYSTTGGNQNPLYNEMVALSSTQNLVASSTAVSAFNRNNDKRVSKFYDLVEGQTVLNSIGQGTYGQSGVEKIVSIPSSLVGGNASVGASATAPVKLISVAESFFLQAEAVARGWAAGDVNTLVQQGITASFVATGLTAADASAYYAAAPDAKEALDLALTAEAKIKVIITQKYYAMCGFQGFEAWTEYRRTGYPDFLVTSAASVIGAGRLPERMVYPNSEATSNLSFPGNVAVYTPMWWAKK
ncbi:SusD/RagB family nutrient-binding outer membrane lipoprotein [Pedobacter sp.]|uniref:SusD/RagB family nutrient-binding outer membrane lipoprotein n=1 Tax=Pedobacter sp. TaxID=1411316 RepID=UPI003D7F29C8